MTAENEKHDRAGHRAVAVLERIGVTAVIIAIVLMFLLPSRPEAYSEKQLAMLNVIFGGIAIVGICGFAAQIIRARVGKLTSNELRLTSIFLMACGLYFWYATLRVLFFPP